MSFGFLTASGKAVKVSEEALKRAKDIFGKLESENEGILKREADGSGNNEGSTPVRPLEPKRFCSDRKRFRSPAFVSPVVKDSLTRSDSSATPLSAVSPSEASLSTWSPNLTSTPVVTPLKETYALNKPQILGTPSTPSSSRGRCKTVTPVKLLTPFCRNWRLCVKVTELEGTRKFRGMEVFSFLAADDSGVEVRITAFNELAQKVAKQIVEGKMYYISNASVRPVDKRFGRNHIDTEIIVRQETQIMLCTDTSSTSPPQIRFFFVKLKNICNFLDREIDLIGILHEINDVREMTNKSGELMDRRDVKVVDDTGYIVTVLLWGEYAKNFESSVSQIIAVKRAFVREYQSLISVTTVANSKIVIDPDLAETRSLSQWYRSNKNKEFLSVSAKWLLNFDICKWIRAVDRRNPPQCFSIVALILNVNLHNATYKGCEKCRKKIIETENGYRCGKCNVTVEDYKYFYSLNLEVCDFTGSHNLSVFNDVAEKLLEETADEVAKYINYDYDRYSSYFKRLFFKKYVFRIGIRTHEGSSILTNRPNSNWLVVDFCEVPYDAYVAYLKKCISLYES